MDNFYYTLTIQILQKYKMILSEETGIKVVESNGTDYQYQIHTAGIYNVIEVKGLLNLIWDNKTSLMLQLHPKFKVGITPTYTNTLSSFTLPCSSTYLRCDLYDRARCVGCVETLMVMRTMTL